jgi:hypothetical protein
MAGEAWAPTLSDVARHVPTRTRDTTTPGSDKLLGTFNQNTTPTDAQVQQLIDDAAASLIASVGALDPTANLAPDIATAARVYVEWRAATDIEIAYPNRDADIQLVAVMETRVTGALATLKSAIAESGGGLVDVATPFWAFPNGPLFPDQSPASGADFAIGYKTPPGLINLWLRLRWCSMMWRSGCCLTTLGCVVSWTGSRLRRS